LLARIRVQATRHQESIAHGMKVNHALSVKKYDKKWTVADPTDPTAPLLPHAEAVVEEALHGDGEPNEVLCQHEAIRSTVSRSDLAVLLPEGWLNDEVINFYFSLLAQRNDRLREEKGWPKCHFMSTFFFSKLIGGSFAGEVAYNYANVKRWTKKVDVFSMDLLLIPVNLGNLHWALLTIDLAKTCINYYDSLGGSGTHVINALGRWLEDESRAKRGVALDTSHCGANFWTRRSHGKTIPQQNNMSDCGVFTCEFAQTLSKGSSDFGFSAEDMPYMRRRVCHELCAAYIQ